MSNPLVSIHVMTYNQVEFIEETLESALGQTYNNIEIVVSDDGSTDGTGEIILDYASRFPNKIVPIVEEHIGIAPNANRALAACTGEYVAILNGDDVFLPDKIEQQVEWMEVGSDRVLCGHDIMEIDANSTVVSGRRLNRKAQLSGRGPANFLRYGCPFAAVSVMVRRSAIPEYGFDPRLNTALDWKLWLDVLCHGGSYGQVPGVHAHYRVHALNSTHTRYDKMWVDRFSGLGIFEAEHPEWAEACRHARAYLYYRRAVGELRRDERQPAIVDFMRSISHHPTGSWKRYGWLALALMPPQLSEPILSRFRV